jgi:hypothetical protein
MKLPIKDQKNHSDITAPSFSSYAMNPDVFVSSPSPMFRRPSKKVLGEYDKISKNHLSKKRIITSDDEASPSPNISSSSSSGWVKPRNVLTLSSNQRNKNIIKAQEERKNLDNKLTRVKSSLLKNVLNLVDDNEDDDKNSDSSDDNMIGGNNMLLKLHKMREEQYRSERETRLANRKGTFPVIDCLSKI